MREAVKNRGGECSRASFAKENMLDQVAYIKMRIAIDIGRRIQGAPLKSQEGF